MSDNYRIICTEKEIDDPQKTIERVIKWLQEKEIIEKTLTDSVLSSKGLGYKPAIKHLEAVQYDENIMTLKVCGVEPKYGREVFNSGAYTMLTKTICPICNENRFKGITPMQYHMEQTTKEQQKSFGIVFNRFTDWIENRPSTLKCNHCNKETSIDLYHFDNTINLSNAGLTFWNWPEFKQDFKKELRKIFQTEIKIIVGHL